MCSLNFKLRYKQIKEYYNHHVRWEIEYCQDPLRSLPDHNILTVLQRYHYPDFCDYHLAFLYSFTNHVCKSITRHIFLSACYTTLHKRNHVVCILLCLLSTFYVWDSSMIAFKSFINFHCWIWCSTAWICHNSFAVF